MLGYIVMSNCPLLKYDSYLPDTQSLWLNKEDTLELLFQSRLS